MPTPSAPPFPTRSGRVLVVLLVLWGLGAVAGGFALASAKDGSGIGFELDLLEGTPFPDFLLPGLVLLALGLAAVALAVVLGRAVHHRRMPAWLPPLLLLTGLGILAWIVGEIALALSTTTTSATSSKAALASVSRLVGSSAWASGSSLPRSGRK